MGNKKKRKEDWFLQLVDQTRDRSVRCRSAVFKDKSKYDRNRQKTQFRNELRKG